jgi:hypothetical protein
MNIRPIMRSPGRVPHLLQARRSANRNCSRIDFPIIIILFARSDLMLLVEGKTIV